VKGHIFMKNRLFSLFLALILLLAPLSLSGCSSPPPELHQVYDIVVDLVERSYAANDLLYGYGLPTIDINSRWGELNYIYSENDYADYEYVMELSPYVSISAIKDELESVYSEEFLDSYYQSLFEGFVSSGHVFRARYRETEDWLYQDIDNKPLITWQRIYDYSTMKIVRPSRGDYVSLSIDTHLEGGDEILPVTIAILWQDGEWRLDSATY
jgi:hypothetical protein